MKVNINGEIICAKNMDVLKKYHDNYFDAVVTDPPYGFKFMGKKWDYEIPSAEFWREVLRVLKPGAFLVCACGTRTQHRMAVNIEDAGFEIRDVITWHYATGFPKSHDVSKAIDKAAGAERKVVSRIETKSGGMARVNKVNEDQGFRPNNYNEHGNIFEVTEPATDDAKQWDGWGTALKPTTEFWTLARKPLSEKSVSENVLKWGTGALNIDACRIDIDPNDENIRDYENHERKSGSIWGNANGANKNLGDKGRFPSNLILDEFAAELLDQQSGFSETKRIEKPSKAENGNTWGGTFQTNRGARGYTDMGGASRFFYIAKASGEERNAGLEKLMTKLKQTQMRSANGTGEKNFEGGFQDNYQQNTHPTVKPISLMQHLIRLVTPVHGLLLDPYAGSGSTGCAAELEEIRYVLIDEVEEYAEISELRCKHWARKYFEENKMQPTLFDFL